MFYESTGFCSLVEKYTCANHAAKFAKFEKIVGKELFNRFREDELVAPDLFVYSPNRRGAWFFCEVKGGRDKLNDRQSTGFRKLYEITKRQVCVLYLKEG